MSEANRAFYDRISGAYDLIADANEHAAREVGERLLDLAPGETVLEVGFGTGNTLTHLADAVGGDGRVDGIDVSPGMLEVARRKLEEHPLASRVHLREGDARELPYEDSSFDAAFASFTLELFEDEDLPRVLAELRRVLRPGGRLAVVSMARVPEGEHASLLGNAYVWMHRHFPHIVDCRPIDAEGVLREAGFEILDRRDLDIWTLPVSAVLARRS